MRLTVGVNLHCGRWTHRWTLPIWSGDRPIGRVWTVNLRRAHASAYYMVEAR